MVYIKSSIHTVVILYRNKQTNVTGVFAIANAMAIVNGKILEEQNYMVSRMR